MADLNEKDQKAVSDASQKPTDSPPKNTSDPVSGDKGVDVKETGHSSGRPGGSADQSSRRE
jgi:hypothetical protein